MELNIDVEYPELRDLPLLEAQVILLASAGIEKTTIADGLDIGRTTVYEILKRNKVYDKIKSGISLQVELTKLSIGEVMVEASALVRMKKGELKGMSLKQLMAVMQQCSSILSTMKVNVDPQKKKELDDEVSAFNALEAYSEGK